MANLHLPRFAQKSVSWLCPRVDDISELSWYEIFLLVSKSSPSCIESEYETHMVDRVMRPHERIQWCSCEREDRRGFLPSA